MPVMTAEQVAAYDRDGYLIAKRMFDQEETDLLRRSAKEDRELEQRSFRLDDGEGGKVRMSLWNHPGDGIYGMFARCRRIVDSMEKILEGEPGDALFFHCNTLHRSDQNRSDQPRWSLICCYNAARNDPYKDSHHPRYTPLNKVDDTAIKEVGIKRFADDNSNVDWLDPAEDRSARSLEDSRSEHD